MSLRPVNRKDSIFTLLAKREQGIRVPKDVQQTVIDRILRQRLIDNSENVVTNLKNQNAKLSALKLPSAVSFNLDRPTGLMTCFGKKEVSLVDASTRHIFWSSVVVDGDSNTKISGGKVIEIAQDYLVCALTTGKKDPKTHVAAFNRQTGNLLWKQPFDNIKVDQVLPLMPNTLLLRDQKRMVVLGLENKGITKQVLPKSFQIERNCSILTVDEKVLQVSGKGLKVYNRLDKLPVIIEFPRIKDDGAKYSMPQIVTQKKSHKIVALTQIFKKNENHKSDTRESTQIAFEIDLINYKVMRAISFSITYSIYGPRLETSCPPILADRTLYAGYSDGTIAVVDFDSLTTKKLYTKPGRIGLLEIDFPFLVGGRDVALEKRRDTGQRIAFWDLRTLERIKSFVIPFPKDGAHLTFHEGALHRIEKYYPEDRNNPYHIRNVLDGRIEPSDNSFNAIETLDFSVSPEQFTHIENNEEELTKSLRLLRI